jgi:COP9 signalosome complex subunit 7
VAELESLVIEANYANLLEASLDPQSQIVHILSVAPLRDLKPGSLQDLLATYNEWESHCDQALGTLEAEIKSIRIAARRKQEREAKLRSILDEKLAEIGSDDKSGSGTRGGKRGIEGVASIDGDGELDGTLNDGMDVDGDEAPARASGTGGRGNPPKRVVLGR